MSEQCGTPAYIAPEILLDRGYEGFAVDVWSAGVVLYAMLFGAVPFKANNMTELQKVIIAANYTLGDSISKEAANLLKGLLEKDPSKRITLT
jgi:serine/threonine protein kinase